MKFVVILLTILTSCSRIQNKKSDPNFETESDSKMTSPHTVSPCYCMKILDPVCADKINYGNSCEAECYGHKKWTKGYCSK